MVFHIPSVLVAVEGEVAFPVFPEEEGAVEHLQECSVADSIAVLRRKEVVVVVQARRWRVVVDLQHPLIAGSR